MALNPDGHALCDMMKFVSGRPGAEPGSTVFDTVETGAARIRKAPEKWAIKPPIFKFQTDQPQIGRAQQLGIVSRRQINCSILSINDSFLRLGQTCVNN